jgi:hypothetical protein
VKPSVMPEQGGHAKADPFDIILIHNHIKIYVVKDNSFYFLNFLSKQIKTQSCLPDKAAGGTLRLDNGPWTQNPNWKVTWHE